MAQRVWVPKKAQPAADADADGERRPVRRLGFGGAAGALLRQAGALQPGPRPRRGDLPAERAGPRQAPGPALPAAGLPPPPGLAPAGRGEGGAAVPTPPVAKVDAKELLLSCFGTSEEKAAAAAPAAPAAGAIGYFSMDQEAGGPEAEEAASEEGEDYDIEDMFDFDPSKMAALLQGDAAAAGPAEQTAPPPAAEPAPAQPPAAPAPQTELAKAIQKAMERAQERHRRSASEAGAGAAVEDRIEQAIEAAHARRRGLAAEWREEAWQEGAALGEHSAWPACSTPCAPPGVWEGGHAKEKSLLPEAWRWNAEGPAGSEPLKMPFAWRCGSA